MAPPPLDVSVIVPAYMAETFIARALNSIAGQTVLPREVIVVDDGSTDGTAAAAEACRGALGAVDLKIFRQDNLGAGAARNRAVREAGCTYLAFLDADDEWLPTKLEQSFAALSGETLDLVAHNYTAVAPDGTESHVDCHARFRNGPDAFAALYRKGYLSTSTLVTRRDLVIAAGGFDVALGNAQDFELWLTVLAANDCRFTVFDAALMRYHVTAGSVTTNTRRRLLCSLEIAHRFAPTLRGRPGGVYRNLWYRTLAIHLEAFQARRAHGDMVRAAGTLLAFLPRLVSISWRTAVEKPAPRAKYV